jgi:hypothetical protein
LNALPSADHYQLEQYGPAALRIRVSPSASVAQQGDIRRALAQCIERAGAGAPQMEFGVWTAGLTTQKCRRVRRLIDVPGGRLA